MKPGNLPDQARCQYQQPVSGWMIRGERTTDPQAGVRPPCLRRILRPLLARGRFLFLMEVNRMEMNLVLSSWLNWEAGELLPDGETCRAFADRGDAAAYFLAQVEKVRMAAEKEVRIIRENPRLQFTSGYTCTVTWFQESGNPSDSAEKCLAKLAKAAEKASENGMDPAVKLKEMLFCYDGCTYEPAKKPLPLDDAIESLAEALG
jgi:hypothetical protein